MYQMPTAAPVNNRKWNLGRLALVPVRLRGMGSVYDPPTIPGYQNPSPVAGAASNAGITTVNAAQPSTDPLSYVSPQQAVAQGLNPQAVQAAWTAALSKFASPQDAVAAGFPAGVVNQYWVAAPPPAPKQQGIPFWLLLTGGLAIAGIAFSGRGRS
jgi:hypothetical protein